jgi:hypothetical protein
MNAIKHGLTARVVLLPGEKPAEFNDRMRGWFDAIRPQNAYERFHAERAVYCSWQLDRCTSARSARMYLKALNGRAEERRRVEQEVTEQSQILFQTPFGRPAGCPFAELPDGPAATTSRGNMKDSEHPKRVILRLKTTGLGCEWLYRAWSELGEVLERGYSWDAAERFRAFRLLGIHAIDAYMTSELEVLLQACQVLDAGAVSIVGEIWNELVPANALADLETMYQRLIVHTHVLDQDESRQYLLDIVRREIASLEQHAQEHEEQAELESDLAPNLYGIDPSPEGLLQLRYEFAWERLLGKHTGELEKGREERKKRGEPAHSRYYMGPSKAWLIPSDDPDEPSLERVYDDYSDDAQDEAWDRASLEPTNEEAVTGAALRVIVDVQDEAGVVGLEGDLRNEPYAEERHANTDALTTNREAAAAISEVDASLQDEPRAEEDWDGTGAREAVHEQAIVNSGAGGPANAGHPSDWFSRMMEEALQSIEEGPRPAIVRSQRRDRGHGQAGGGSRRARRRRERNRESARARELEGR